MSHRFEGRNLEDALQNAAQSLGVPRWQLTHHTLLEKRGFLGGVKRIVIEVEVNEDAQPPAVPAALDPLPGVPPRRERAGGGGRGPRSGRSGGRGDRGHQQARGEHRGGARGRRSGGRELRVGDFETFLGDLPEQGPESPAATEVRQWCERVIGLAQLDLVTRSEENDSQILIRLYGADSRRMIDRHGELLDALQVLANKALVGRKTDKDIELDCEDFKEQRNEDLAERARTVADRVRESGREELMPAMSPIERRIVHIALRDDADVTTESRGEGFFKRVAVILRSESGQGETQPAQES